MATATKTRKKTRKPTVTVTIAMFDDRYDQPAYRPLRTEQPIGGFVPLTEADYSPQGGTPLHDATAKFIGHLDQLQRPGTVVIGALADESGSMHGNQQSVIDGINEFVGGMADVEVDPDADGKVLAVILTDGMENASKETTHRQVAEMIREREAHNWTFLYLGANQDAWAVGGKLGVTRSANFVSSARGTGAVMGWAGEQGRSYLSNNAAYATMACSAQNVSISEDDSVTDQSGALVDEAASLAKRMRGGK